MDNESIHSESECYLYPEKQDKYGLFVFCPSTREITLSIKFSYTPESRHELKFLLILRGEYKYVIHWPGSVGIG